MDEKPQIQTKNYNSISCSANPKFDNYQDHCEQSNADQIYQRMANYPSVKINPRKMKKIVPPFGESPQNHAKEVSINNRNGKLSTPRIETIETLMTCGDEEIEPIDLPVFVPQNKNLSLPHEEYIAMMNTASHAESNFSNFMQREHVESIIEFDAKFCTDLHTLEDEERDDLEMPFKDSFIHDFPLRRKENLDQRKHKINFNLNLPTVDHRGQLLSSLQKSLSKINKRGEKLRKANIIRNMICNSSNARSNSSRTIPLFKKKHSACYFNKTLNPDLQK
ncbi:unnamed protein product [Moneuplotes crassus]|uniref:Uncharacterized protein n=1 Tax=Euplotes crassus TaxID=5936 RepID=A0AAD1UNN3_EUPCR|nr:unnamed protein product [Moneuplotes crassus]